MRPVSRQSATATATALEWLAHCARHTGFRVSLGIRMALGAHRDDILRMVLRKGVVLVTAGILLGFPLKDAVPRLLKQDIYVEVVRWEDFVDAL